MDGIFFGCYVIYHVIVIFLIETKIVFFFFATRGFCGVWWRLVLMFSIHAVCVSGAAPVEFSLRSKKIGGGNIEWRKFAEMAALFWNAAHAASRQPVPFRCN